MVLVKELCLQIQFKKKKISKKFCSLGQVKQEEMGVNLFIKLKYVVVKYDFIQGREREEWMM